MKNFAILLKPLALSIALFAIFTATQGVARADEVTIAGDTNGCFGAACAPPTTNGGAQSATLLGLTYRNSTFSGTTSGGFLNPGNAPGTPNVDNLGSFALNSTATPYNGSFTLRVTFTAPGGITGSNTALFSAVVTGSVSSTSNGGVFINFDNTPQLFTFSYVDGNGRTNSGSFTFFVNDVSVIPGGIIALSGNIMGAQQTAVPEPATMLLLGTGLAGVAARIRKRRKDAAQS